MEFFLNRNLCFAGNILGCKGMIMTSSKLYLGVDVGSVSVKVVLLDENKQMHERHYLRHKGHPGQTLLHALEEIFTRHNQQNIFGIGFTGSGGKRLSEILNGKFANEVIAEARSVSSLHPEVRTIINIGGQDSKLILITPTKDGSSFVLDNFSMNTLCAAGTGSFLDQQAGRLGISIEDEFGQMALKSEHPPRIAGRCSVFAKSDMIHLQQKGTPDYDIVAGLCYAMARNFKATIGKNVEFKKKVAFIGGVAKNEGVVKAFGDILHLEEGDLIIPKDNELIGAYGAALNVLGDGTPFKGLEDIRDYLKNLQDIEEGHEPLILRDIHKRGESEVYADFRGGEDKINAFLGVDVGSISTNVVVIDENGKILSKKYLRTKGKPLDAVKKGIKEVGREVSSFVEIKGACATGSGRYLTGDFIGADVVKDEITAHARGARQTNESVDTIFEIGGQDAKYISLEKGVIVDFEMNKVCAAGTGSFLEEQASRLGVDIKSEFSEMALSSKNPSRCGDRCTVFMESDLVHHQQKGAPKEDIIAGLCYSIVLNYLNKVVEGRKIGDTIFFQGGTAFNKGVVAAFEKIVGKDIIVPEHHEVMGAYGSALIALDRYTGGQSKFKGFNLANSSYEIKPFECKSCSNACTINKVTIEGAGVFYYGSRCDKYEVKKTREYDNNFEDLFKFREELLYNTFESVVEKGKGRARVGIPLSMTMLEEYPFWKAFFTTIGCEIILSEPTHRWHINKGLETVVDETCFPMRVLHGHVLELIERDDVDYLFLPQILELEHESSKSPSFRCPYIQAIPDILRTAINFEALGINIMRPAIRFSLGENHLVDELMKEVGSRLKIGKGEIRKAIEAALNSQNTFKDAIRAKGKEVLDSLKEDEMAIVVVSRPYNGCDRGVNLDIPQKLSDLGVRAIPMDFLPLESQDISEEHPYMMWFAGQSILSAANIIRENPSLFAVYITNFCCGPDSFLLQYFRREMGNKPYLQLEIDEHSADAGVVTRLEAYVDSLRHAPRKSPTHKSIPKSRFPSLKGRTLYVPPLSDDAYAIAAAFKGSGMDAEVLPMADTASLEWGRKYTNGKECYPHIITTGDMVKKIMSPGFDPAKAAFFMPTGSAQCRLNHYNTWQKIVLDELGYGDVPILSLDMDTDFWSEVESLSLDVGKDTWKGFMAIDTIFKALHETKPYEKNKGESQKVYDASLKKISDTIIAKDDIVKAMREIREEFEAIATDKSVLKPLVGVVGEIFVRNHAFSNNNLIEQIEDLGGEVWLTPFSEILLYINYNNINHSKWKGDWKGVFDNWLKDRYFYHKEHQIQSTFEGFLRNYPEPKVKDLAKKASKYFNPVGETETVMTVGKTVRFIEQGISGMINVVPFTCMPGVVAASMFKRLKEDYPDVAFLTLKYDGNGDINMRTRLEAFMHQAEQYQNLKS